MKCVTAKIRNLPSAHFSSQLLFLKHKWSLFNIMNIIIDTIQERSFY